VSSSKVSVVIPAYNQAEFLGEAINSVIEQTYINFELIIVDDASTDDLENIVKLFNDPRIIFIRHERNMGADAARITGIHASCGEVIAFLDQDDLFHPEKIQAHIEFRERHPEIGLTYNSRFELNYSANTIRELRRPPTTVTLSDLVQGFPIAPSEIVISREWAMREDIWSERRILHGGEYIFLGRLQLAGCKLGCVDRALNYRRHHSGRVMDRLEDRCKDELFAQNVIFTDPRCPSEVRAIRNVAFANTYMVFCFMAMVQKETKLGQKLLREAVRLLPRIIHGNPCPFVEMLAHMSSADENLDHSELLKNVFVQLPTDINYLSNLYDWTVGRVYLLKGIRALMWGRSDDGADHFDNAIRWNAQLDKPLLRQLAYKIGDIEAELGQERAEEIFRHLSPYLEEVGGKPNVRWLESTLSLNRAHGNYKQGKFSQVPPDVRRAFTVDPRNLSNRGMWSILMRSFFNQLMAKVN
jgi:glycosyltransferase involved in cell wall biosynthesis